MARIPYPDPARVPEKVRASYEKLSPKLNVFRMLLGAPSCTRGFLHLGSQILGRQKLAPRLREIAILRVAALSGARYEWAQHVAIARECGLDDGEISAIEGGAAERLEPLERDLVRFTDECVRDVRVSDPTFEALRRRLSDEEICELLLAVGFYMMVARFLETLDVDLEPELRASLAEVGERRSRRTAAD